MTGNLIVGVDENESRNEFGLCVMKPKGNNYTVLKMVLDDEARILYRAITEQSFKVQEEVGRCKDCKYFEYDSVAKVDGVPLIVAHEICNKWGNGCKSREDGYCFLFEEKESEEVHCNHTDAEIAKSFIEDVGAVKDLLPRAESEG